MQPPASGRWSWMRSLTSTPPGSCSDGGASLKNATSATAHQSPAAVRTQGSRTDLQESPELLPGVLNIDRGAGGGDSSATAPQRRNRVSRRSDSSPSRDSHHSSRPPAQVRSRSCGANSSSSPALSRSSLPPLPSTGRARTDPRRRLVGTRSTSPSSAFAKAAGGCTASAGMTNLKGSSGLMVEMA